MSDPPLVITDLPDTNGTLDGRSLSTGNRTYRASQARCRLSRLLAPRRFSQTAFSDLISTGRAIAVTQRYAAAAKR